MSVNKVQLANGETIIDISDSTVTPETLAEGVTAHDASGQKITGKMVPGGGGKTVQTDWNQMDETAPDYLKNKPFGDELVEIMPEMEVTGVANDDGTFTVLIPENIYIGDQDTLYVTFDGVVYVCDAKLDGMLYGNGVFFGEEDTGEPFAIIPIFDSIFVVDRQAHNISISRLDAVKIPEKYYDTATVLYISVDSNDVYLYTDPSLTVKVTLEELQALSKTKPFVMNFANNGYANKNYLFTAVFVNADNTSANGIKYGYVVVYDGDFHNYYTTEYVLET